MTRTKKTRSGIYIKSKEQIDGIRKSSQLASQTLLYLKDFVKPGVTTNYLDELCHEYTLDHGAIPAPLGYHGFPKSVCISVNDVICHGIPSDRVLKDGDIVNIDVTPILEGYFGDTNFTFLCGEVSDENKKLIQTTFDATFKGIEQVFPGNRLSNIGFKIQKFVEKKGYSVVQDYTGHGVGIEFHEAPTVLHYGRPNRGEKLMPGMIFTIEPMVNLGKYKTKLDPSDGWTVTTIDGKNSAQFEHSLLVTETGVEVLTHNEELWGKLPDTLKK
ncbi:MAG: type I methionyl aminopeptidase [Candidatus Cloacimonadota bacterium]|nr:MAG: type I methionyl aminopeptidase [Candidatus Cloacimonadota bacterium]